VEDTREEGSFRILIMDWLHKIQSCGIDQENPSQDFEDEVNFLKKLMFWYKFD